MLMIFYRQLKRLTPGWLLPVIGRFTGPIHRRRWARNDARAYDLTEGRVIGGPFSGMRYVRQTQCGALGPKLLGTYELELVPVVDQIIAASPAQLIDIGGAEGYYAVGLLLRLPELRVIAYEATAWGQSLMREMARLNDVSDRLEIRGLCDAQGLSDALEASPGCVIICDIEGGEREVLDPAVVWGLGDCDILVERHDLFVPGVSALLRERFESTHEMVSIVERPRNARDLPVALRDDARRCLPLLSELRQDEMAWYWMRRR